MKELRVIAIEFNYWENDESCTEVYQYLQVKRRFLGIPYWKTIDSEKVPSYAWIMYNTLGSTDWKSKFRDIPGVVFTNKKRKP